MDSDSDSDSEQQNPQYSLTSIQKSLLQKLIQIAKKSSIRKIEKSTLRNRSSSESLESEVISEEDRAKANPSPNLKITSLTRLEKGLLDFSILLLD